MSRQVVPWPAHLSHSSVERVDVDGEGRRVLTLVEGTALQWWVESPGGWTPTGPAEDRALPFAGTLGEALAPPGTRVLAWKPGRRLVLLAPRGERAVVQKAHKRSAFERARDAHRAAEAALGRGPWRAAPLVVADPGRALLEFEFEEGGPLEFAERAADLYFRLGAGLSNLQQARFETELRPHRASDEVQVVAQLRARAERCGAVLPVDFGATAARLDAALARFDEGESAPCHRDLHDGQFLHARERLVCLDFDLLCRADTALDPANFVAHLQLRAMQSLRGSTAASALALARAFLEGLDRDGERGFGARLCWYQAATFLRLAAVHSMRPRWLHLVPELVLLSRRCLEDLERA